MWKDKLILAATLILFGIAGYNSMAIPAVSNFSEDYVVDLFDTEHHYVKFRVDGMSCGNCVDKITTALKKSEGVKRVRVSLENSYVNVKRNPDKVSDNIMLQTINELGYQATSYMGYEKKRNALLSSNLFEFSVVGMTCKSCENKIKSALSTNPDFQWIDVSKEKGKLKIYSNSSKIDQDKVVKNLNALGYEVSILH